MHIIIKENKEKKGNSGIGDVRSVSVMVTGFGAQIKICKQRNLKDNHSGVNKTVQKDKLNYGLFKQGNVASFGAREDR